MNSHERRVVERYWPHCVNVANDDARYADLVEWLNKNFGSCSFKRRQSPRWCWRPVYTDLGNFAHYWSQTQLYFRKEKDYLAFLLRWDNE